MTPRLLEKYNDEILPSLAETCGRENPLALPRLEKVAVNMGVGSATTEKKHMEDAVAALTSRELEVFHLIALGVPVRDIATQLQLSPKTVESYRERIKVKLNIDSAAKLARYAQAWALEQGN